MTEAADNPMAERALRIYFTYPRKAGKPYAIKCINRALVLVAKEKFGRDIAQATEYLYEQTKKYADSPEVHRLLEIKQNGGENFMPYPSTWFNRGYYEDPEDQWGYGQPESLSTVERLKKQWNEHDAGK